MSTLTQKEKRIFARNTKGVEKIMLEHDSVAYCFANPDRHYGGGLNCEKEEPNAIYSTRSLFDWDKVEQANRESING